MTAVGIPPCPFNFRTAGEAGPGRGGVAAESRPSLNHWSRGLFPAHSTGLGILLQRQHLSLVWKQEIDGVGGRPMLLWEDLCHRDTA